MNVMSAAEFTRAMRAPDRREAYSAAAGKNYVCVGDVIDDLPLDHLPPCPVLSLAGACSIADVTVSETELADMAFKIDAQPYAAATLVGLLRHNQSLTISGGLTLESLAYSTLQHSVGFETWLETHEPGITRETEAAVLVSRTEDRLTLTLNRPAKHNAYNSAMRDALCEGLGLAHADPTLKSLTLCAAGPSFCAGGDLNEFGAARDAGAAHLSRMTRSAGWLLASFDGKSEARLHGACIGAGIELPAFTTRVIASEDAFFQLPEVALGLIPGAGGTVSISRRIGRQQTAHFALSGTRIDAATALNWGLVDELAA